MYKRQVYSIVSSTNPPANYTNGHKSHEDACFVHSWTPPTLMLDAVHVLGVRARKHLVLTLPRVRRREPERPRTGLTHANTQKMQTPSYSCHAQKNTHKKIKLLRRIFFNTFGAPHTTKHACTDMEGSQALSARFVGHLLVHHRQRLEDQWHWINAGNKLQLL